MIDRMKTLHVGILWVSLAVLCWLGMMAVHELGHVIGAWATGGRVARVVLHPLTISRTDLAENPQPLVVVWSGPVLGVLLPAAAWLVAAGLRWNQAYLLRFFAGFCLIANGGYIGCGSFERIGDCGVMLQNGAAPWQLWVFGIITVPAGLALWHRQGAHFGLGPTPVAHDSRTPWICLMLAIVLTGMCLLLRD
jgi:hypothetical protein